MKRMIFLTMVALLTMLVFAPVALAQGGTSLLTGVDLAPTPPPTGGMSTLWPAAALLLGSGILTYSILRRR